MSDEGLPPVMTPSVVCFMDVLGSQQAMVGADAQEVLERLSGALTAAAARVEESAQGAAGLEVIWFTDNVVITWAVGTQDDGEMELGGMFVTASWFMLMMAVEGFFVRGGISVGDIYVNDHFAFGPALVQAVKLEHDGAVHPRTVLSEEAVVLAKHHTSYYASPADSPQASELVVDQFGAVFLNYLAMLEEEDDQALQMELLERHREQITLALETSASPRVRDKLQWLGRYHNHYCESTWPDSHQLLVESSLLSPQMASFL